MSNSCDQLEEIKALISSNSKQSKSFGYSSLLHFQEQSTSIPSAVQALAHNVPSLVASIVSDMFDEDEETAAQALKCLGFMIYHPSLIAAVLVDDVSLVLQSLTKLIMSTKLKSVRNLGVWCISIQQLNVSFLASHFHSLLRAVILALDNPIGSLSTTFEALQAVMKLASQLSENMRELSHIWVPPICRRLLSSEKKERDMSERCLLNIKSTMIPPTLALSKALAEEMKKNLLARMKDLLNQDMKIETIQAWGWFIRLLGYHAIRKNRHLINDMLKVPELTFSDHNPQVQIASLAAWEGLIDTLIYLPILPRETNRDVENGYRQVRTPKGNIYDIQENAALKNIKLIMTPLIGIFSSKCEVSVISSCMTAWCYLLHKLDTSINCPSVMKLVLDPILEAVFQKGPHGKDIWSWNLCLELLHDSILVKFKDVNCDTNGLRIDNLPVKTSMLGPSISGEDYWKQYPIKWLPWDLSRVDFFENIIYIITCPISMKKVSYEDQNSTCDAALKIFRSVLKAVQMEIKNLAVDYKDIVLCLNSILRFTAKICEDLSSEGKGNNDMHHASLSFVEAVTEELEPSILGSPLYKVALGIKFIEKQPSGNNIKHAKVLGISSVTFMDMVSPVVYLMVIYIRELVGLTLNKPRMDFYIQKSYLFFKFLFFSYDPLEVLLATNGLLYERIRYCHLQIWTAIAEGLKEWIHSVKDLSFLNKESDSTYCLAICHLLSYPFVICPFLLSNSTPVKVRSSLEEAIVSSERSIEHEHVIEVWKSLYASVITSKIEYSTSSFPEDLCSVINGCLDDSTSMLVLSTEIDSSKEDLDPNLLCLSGDVVICILEHIKMSELSSSSAKTKLDGGHKISGFDNIVGLAARFLKFSRMKLGLKPLNGMQTSKVFSSLACFVNCLVLPENIVSFFKIISCPLLLWLSLTEIQDQATSEQLQRLWAETLNSLQKSQPPIIFDSAFLKLQASLLEKALNHPSFSISEPTISFWNSTYGKQVELYYPQNLLHVLDKLSRSGRINLFPSNQPLLKRSHSGTEDIAAPQKYRVTATHNGSSKRVEIMEETINMIEQKGQVSASPKRGWSMLTAHQKEVRRAQQGREWDCGGHGPGIRTYTNVDFSQGNDELPGTQDY